MLSLEGAVAARGCCGCVGLLVTLPSHRRAYTHFVTFDVNILLHSIFIMRNLHKIFLAARHSAILRSRGAAERGEMWNEIENVLRKWIWMSDVPEGRTKCVAVVCIYCGIYSYLQQIVSWLMLNVVFDVLLLHCGGKRRSCRTKWGQIGQQRTQINKFKCFCINTYISKCVCVSVCATSESLLWMPHCSWVEVVREIAF